ncbi:carboxymuconolactone decarboxylase family protei n [Desulfonema ishimotonii]|uniref:Carboxymuconolactone decarboxylase family protei n n=1 Tax=Desulfonema ishimotonii TaxID=45657 RepID=A0A401FXR5_9BACT|nr:carboxymuconolactone decarboxylase family protein [Desulfonema ishimotonii]GBC61739.1 carboxymuconolactone decarboxylase family protei n [Desulfonema ishimotonii]
MNKSIEDGFRKMHGQLPEVMDSFAGLHESVIRDGAVSARTKRLMLVAVSVALRCEPCIRNHVQAAAESGVSREEIIEAVGIAILMAGGPAAAYGSLFVLQILDEMGI